MLSTLAPPISAPGLLALLHSAARNDLDGLNDLACLFLLHTADLGQTDLTKILSCTPPAACQLGQRLISSGLISDISSPRERSVTYRLTAKGRETVTELLRTYRHHSGVDSCEITSPEIAAAILRCFTKSKRTTLSTRILLELFIESRTGTGIATACSCSRTIACTILQKMADLRISSSERGKVDRRNWNFYLTEKGEAAAAKIITRS